MRTSLGFADHHAFDFAWLALTVYALAVLSVRDDPLRDVRAWLAAAGVAVGVAGQTLAWEAGPLLLAPVGLYVAVRALLDVEAERSPLATNAPLLIGLVVGAAVAWVAHTDLGWHTELVASAPLLLLLGSVADLAAAELVHRLDLPTPVLAGVELLGLPVGFVVVQSVRPEYVARLERELPRLLAERNIAETQSLFRGDTFCSGSSSYWHCPTSSGRPSAPIAGRRGGRCLSSTGGGSSRSRAYRSGSSANSRR
jgi:dolichyl-diphosphooligosaccharide--protein glycosyltransferase